MKAHHKYFLQGSILGVVYIFVAALLIFFYPSLLSYVFCLLLLLSYKFIVTYIANRNFITILAHEFNAQKFYSAIYQKPFRPSASYRINAEWYIGNYKKLIDLSSAGFKHSQSLHQKCFYLVYLARAYFDLRDFENLSETVTAFYQLKQDERKMQKLLSRYPAFQYYKAYLDKDFEQCVSLSQKRMEKIRQTRLVGKLQWLNNQSNLGVAYYELGNIEKAKEIFQWFIETTPNLNNFYDLSTNYLESIEKNCSPNSSHLTSDEETAKTVYEFLSYTRKNRIISIICFVLVIFAIGGPIASYFWRYAEKSQEQHEQTSAIAEFEKELNSAISKNYENATFVKYFYVENGEQFIDAFCLINNGDCLDLASIVTYDGGESLDLILLVEDLQISHDYSVKSVVSDYRITFCVSDKPIAGSDYKKTVKFSLNNERHWFGIKDITPLP